MNISEYVKKRFTEGDKFLALLGVQVESASHEQTVCSIRLKKEEHYNAGGGVQGGVLYTLADMAFALAANCSGNETVTLSGAIRYIAKTEGKKLTATATLTKATRKICFYEVKISDDLDVLIATADFTGYILKG